MLESRLNRLWPRPVAATNRFTAGRAMRLEQRAGIAGASLQAMLN